MAPGSSVPPRKRDGSPLGRATGWVSTVKSVVAAARLLDPSNEQHAVPDGDHDALDPLIARDPVVELA